MDGNNDATVSTPDDSDSTTTFQKGDRVVIRLLGKRRHGHVIVAVGLQHNMCAIHLDTGNSRGQYQTVVVPPNRIIQHEQLKNNENDSIIPLSCTIQNRAPVSNGALVSGAPVYDGSSYTYNAIAMNGIMYLIRWITATNFNIPRMDDTKEKTHNQSMTFSLQQIQQLPSDICHKLNIIAIMNWERRCDEENIDKENNNDNDGKKVVSKGNQNCSNDNDIGVYERLVQYFQNHNITSGFIYDALSDIRAIRSWYTCIQQEVWFVAKDDSGSYVIPNNRSHAHVVYKIVGFGGLQQPSPQQQLDNITTRTNQAAVRLIRIPMCLRITILPWYGRLLHDTSIPIISNESTTSPRLITATDPNMAHRLHTVVLHAIQTSTVLEHFAELEPLLQS